MTTRILRAGYRPGEEYHEETGGKVIEVRLTKIANLREHPVLQGRTLLEDLGDQPATGYAVTWDRWNLGLLVRVHGFRKGRRQRVPVRFEDGTDPRIGTASVSSEWCWLAVDMRGWVVDWFDCSRHACHYLATACHAKEM